MSGRLLTPDELEKDANSLPLAAQIASMVLTMGMLSEDKRHQESKNQKRLAKDRAVRREEAHRMGAMIEAMGGVAEKTSAVEAGALLAQLTIEKEAGIGSAAMKLLGQGMAGLGKGMTSAGGKGATKRLTSAASEGVEAGWSKGPNVFQRMGGKLQESGAGLRVKGMERAAAERAGGGASKPLVGWKSKALMGAGIAGAGYAGYKGLQAGRDYMMMPPGSTPRWGTSRPLMHNVSQFGYPVY